MVISLFQNWLDRRIMGQKLSLHLKNKAGQIMAIWNQCLIKKITLFFGDLDRGELEPNQTRAGSYMEDSKRGEAVDSCYGLSVSD